MLDWAAAVPVKTAALVTTAVMAPMTAVPGTAAGVTVSMVVAAVDRLDNAGAEALDFFTLEYPAESAQNLPIIFITNVNIDFVPATKLIHLP